MQKHSNVDITVSKGKETVKVPSVIGQSRDAAVSTLINAGLNPHSFAVHSSKPVDTVIAQDPTAGKVVEKGSTVRINYSSGPAAVTVPSVIGMTFDQASATLRNQGFQVSRTDVDSDQAKGIVVDQSPSGSATPGSTIQLSVSKGPKQSTVPDVTSQDEASARSTLEQAGFTVTVTRQNVTDPGLDGIVLSQNPHRRDEGAAGVDGDDRRRAADRDRAAATAGDAVSRRVRVAVLLGGRSSEHEVSLASARSVIDALDPERYETVTVEIGRDGRWELGTGNGSVAETLPVPTSKVPATLGEVDVVFPVLHGPFGEDGTVQGLLELAGVPYVGAGVLGSALAMDKDVFKAVMRDRGVPVTRNITLRQGEAPGEPLRLPGLRQAGAARLVGRDLEGARPTTSWRRRSRSPSSTTRRCSSRSSSTASRSSAACSATSSPRRRCRARSSRTASRAPTGTTTRPSTTRAAWT